MDKVEMSNLCVSGDTKIKIRYPEPEYEDYGGDIWNWYVVEEEIEIEELDQYIIDRECRISHYAAYEGDPCEDVPQIEVLSYNTETNQQEWAPITAFAETSPKAKVMKITDEESGKSIVVTPEHKVFTKNRGYVMAKDLTETDELVIN
jgi:intein/homing endonuclease